MKAHLARLAYLEQQIPLSIETERKLAKQRVEQEREQQFCKKIIRHLEEQKPLFAARKDTVPAGFVAYNCILDGLQCLQMSSYSICSHYQWTRIQIPKGNLQQTFLQEHFHILRNDPKQKLPRIHIDVNDMFAFLETHLQPTHFYQLSKLPECFVLGQKCDQDKVSSLDDDYWDLNSVDAMYDVVLQFQIWVPV